VIAPTYDFRSQVAVVTGASSGMGLDTVTRAEAARRLGLRRADVHRLEDLALRKLRARPQR
jgi:NAD(P)-dependent dehydrogenase (short-subunit alcohol dehydrogenase family)